MIFRVLYVAVIIVQLAREALVTFEKLLHEIAGPDIADWDFNLNKRSYSTLCEVEMGPNLSGVSLMGKFDNPGHLHFSKTGKSWKG